MPSILRDNYLSSLHHSSEKFFRVTLAFRKILNFK